MRSSSTHGSVTKKTSADESITSVSTLTSGTATTLSKESASLITSHSMRLGIYSINLGTKIGQKLHAAHMLLLPLIPIIIILGQCASDLATYTSSSAKINEVQIQVTFTRTFIFYLCLRT